MIVPKYWAEGRIQKKFPDGKQVTLRRFGWADESQESAQQSADERVAEALKQWEAGEKVPQRDEKIPYNGANGLPVREEILTTVGEAVITRNSYGAHCLNTPDVLIADVDFDQPNNSNIPCVISLAVLIIAALYGVSMSEFKSFVLAFFILAVASYLIMRLLQKLSEWKIKKQGGNGIVTMKRIEEFCQNHHSWKLRVYETPAGMRVIATHAFFKTIDDEVLDFFKQIGTDTMYVRMCILQRCYRARLTAKPWRIGITTHMKPRPGVWPINPERKPERDRWVAHYEATAKNFAACRFLREIGQGASDQVVSCIVKLHDDSSNSQTELPLA